MNEHCICKLEKGYCPRHKINKTFREVELCKGLAATSPSHGRVYWIAWELGKLGATKVDNPILNPDGFGDVGNYVSSNPNINIPTDGPGNDLHDILREAGYEIEEGCSCVSMIRRMNILGVSGCKEHKSEIASHMYEEFKKRHTVIKHLIPSMLVLDKAKQWIDEAINRWESRSAKINT